MRSILGSSAGMLHQTNDWPFNSTSLLLLGPRSLIQILHVSIEGSHPLGLMRKRQLPSDNVPPSVLSLHMTRVQEMAFGVFVAHWSWLQDVHLAISGLSFLARGLTIAQSGHSAAHKHLPFCTAREAIWTPSPFWTKEFVITPFSIQLQAA